MGFSDDSFVPQETSPPSWETLSALSVMPKPSELPFKPFTGKIKGKRVRLRVQPDLESHVVCELGKNDLISVIGEKSDFWAIEPPTGTKAYIFRSFVLDNVVEGNRVNVRLHPDLEAPVIGHLNSGDRIDGVVSPLNNKWYEIPVPNAARFYIAKEYIEHLGGPEIKERLDRRKQAVQQLFDAATLLSKVELRKPYEEIDIDRLSRSFKAIVEEYGDFPDYVEQAKDTLTSLHESYLQKKISFLESKAHSQPNKEEYISLATDKFAEEKAVKVLDKEEQTERMRMWEPIEESLYLTWSRLNEDRTIEDFYDDQKLNAVALSGILESYISPVKNKPGDFILRDRDLPIAYLYSTAHNLQSLVGKKVRVLVTPRVNNNFAFPAYYVLSVE
jgi:hypothetical protein